MKLSKFFLGVGLALACVAQARAEAMLQLFNLSWNEVSQKIPEIAEAGYTSLWLPPPTKGASGYSVGYDLWDPFDLGDKNQRGTVATRYGTKADLQRMMRLAHRFGLRVYFDNIMNHRSFDVPGYNSSTPTNLYPGMVPGDFHLRTIAGGFFRNASNIRDYNSVWQVQNLSLLGLVDIAHESPNANFGASEGNTAAKPVLVRHPNNPEYYDVNSAGARVGFGNVTQADLNANPGDFAEDVNAYLIRSVRYLFDQTKCDGLRLDAVKHVPGYFFGDQSGANKDSSSVGYLGNAQFQYNLAHGFTDSNQRNSNFDTEIVRNDALLFGEHLGEPPGFGDYSDAGMRLLDNPLRNHLNSVLGNPSATLAGLEQRDAGGFSAGVRVMHAQSHDNDFAARRELQNAYYFFREGVPLIYSDGYNQDSGSPPFPRHANAPFLGQFDDRKMPDIAWLHHQLARGGTRPRWGDGDVVAFERYDFRDGGSSADETVVLFAMNDNYGGSGDISFDDGVAQSDSGMPSTCYPAVNSRGQGLVVGFPPGTRLRQMADSPGDSRACVELLVRLATNSRTEAENSKNDGDATSRKVYVGSQALASGGGAIEFKIPSGSYVAYAIQWPEPSRVDTTLTNTAGVVASTDVIVIQQGGRVAPRLTVYRTDGPDGDGGFNPLYPFKMRGSVDLDGDVVRGGNLSNRTYSLTVPVVTNGLMDFLMRTDGSAANVLLKLDGGIDLNSHLNLGASNTFTAGVADLRDNKPGAATDVYLGYEQAAFNFRHGPEKFAARLVSRNTVRSLGAETYSYTVGSDATTNVVLGDGFGDDYSTGAAEWVYHDPAAAINAASLASARVTLLSLNGAWRYDQSGADLGTAWRAPGYNDSAWSNGVSVLALETGGVVPATINTVLRRTNAAGAFVTNFYFRAHFTVPSNSASLTLIASNVIDDGAVFYLNGAEVYRYNMPTGAITATTLATDTVEATNWVVFNLPTDALVAGDNVLAVEVHQVNDISSDIVFGMSLTAAARQRSFTQSAAPVELWVKVGYHADLMNKCFIYYTTDGANPEGAHGVGHGTTRVAAAVFVEADATNGTIDWWKGSIPTQAAGTVVKYKIALHKNNAAVMGDTKAGKYYALTQHGVAGWNPATAQVWLHSDLATNQITTGLQEGFHILRARAFLPRDGKAAVFNTFLQTFYFDAAPPDGEIAFPAAGATLGSVDYGCVVRADDSTTEVEYNIVDGDPNNDDVNTGQNNGNGLSNGVPVFAAATRVTPTSSLNASYPGFPAEFRFTYFAVPTSGSATITVRLKELTTASVPSNVRVLTRAVTVAAPPQTLSVVRPSSNGQNIRLTGSNSYDVVACFSDTLTANINFFTIEIDGAEQPRTNAAGAALYRFEGTTCGAGKRDLRYTWTGMSAGQHFIEVSYVGDGLTLQASKFAFFTLAGVTDSDSDGMPDTWETANGLGRFDATGVNGANGDLDGDGFSNLDEFLAGTQPDDPTSLLRITHIAGGGSEITWASIPGRNYQVFTTTDINAPFVPLSATNTASSSLTSFTNTAPASVKEFYRVKVLP